MRVMIQMSHPAHFHLYKNIAKQLKADGHDVHILIKSKDILEDLLIASGLQYTNIQPVAHRSHRVGIIFDTLLRMWRMGCYVKKHHIDLLTGCSAEVAQIGWLLHKHRINLGEDDATIIPQLIKLIKPFAERYYAPDSCNTGPLEPKTIHYAGYHKLAYLHPNKFTPSLETASKHVDTTKPYFLLRFAKLNAYHDLDNAAHGISTEVAQNLIDLLAPHGNIYITSERALEPQFEKYRLNINPLDIHHVMAFATLYIGDSQSMAVEAAMLGTPSIRFNDFAGRIGVLEELEHKYQLTFGISPRQPELLYSKVKELLSTENLKELFTDRRRRMLAEKIDVTDYLTREIEQLAGY